MNKSNSLGSVKSLRSLPAFSLVELLVAIGIVVLLCAILVPVVSTARARSRDTVCVSNLRQIGSAVLLYAADYDDRFPFGGDPLDLYGFDWKDTRFGPVVEAMDPLQDVMHSYLPDDNIWHCPLDTGFMYGGMSDSDLLNTLPSSWDKYGTSYYYQTGLPLYRNSVSSVHAWSRYSPYDLRGPADIVMLFDGSGAWHGGASRGSRRFGSVFIDGHAKMLNETAFSDATHVAFKPFTSKHAAN